MPDTHPASSTSPIYPASSFWSIIDETAIEAQVADS